MFKYLFIHLLLQSAPQPVVENYELASITLEYRRECMKDSVLQSLTSLLGGDSGGLLAADPINVDCQHLLRLEGGGGEIVKGRTKWRPKYANRFRSVNQLGTESG